jgi:hypothetical protein
MYAHMNKGIKKKRQTINSEKIFTNQMPIKDFVTKIHRNSKHRKTTNPIKWAKI